MIGTLSQCCAKEGDVDKVRLLHSSSGSAGVVDGVNAGSYRAPATFSYFHLQSEAEQCVILCDHIQGILHFMSCNFCHQVLADTPHPAVESSCLPRTENQPQTSEMR